MSMESSTIRARARENLTGNWALSIAVAVVACLLGGMITGATFIPTISAEMRAQSTPSMASTKSPMTNIPRAMVAASIQKMTTELFSPRKILQMVKARISTPPVDPPPKKVRAHPTPTKTPPTVEAKISEVSG